MLPDILIAVGPQNGRYCLRNTRHIPPWGRGRNRSADRKDYRYIMIRIINITDTTSLIPVSNANFITSYLCTVPGRRGRGQSLTWLRPRFSVDIRVRPRPMAGGGVRVIDVVAVIGVRRAGNACWVMVPAAMSTIIPELLTQGRGILGLPRFTTKNSGICFTIIVIITVPIVIFRLLLSTMIVIVWG